MADVETLSKRVRRLEKALSEAKARNEQLKQRNRELERMLAFCSMQTDDEYARTRQVAIK